MHSVSTDYLQSIVRTLSALNVEKKQIDSFSQQIIALSQERRIAMRCYIDLLNLGASAAQNTLFGFELGKQIQMREYGVLGYLVESCENLSQAIASLMRFDSLVANIGKTHFKQTNKIAEITWRPYAKDSKHMVLRNTTAWIVTVRQILNDQLAPIRISFTFPLTTSEIGVLSDYFRCEIIINAANNSVEFPTAYLTHPFSNENKHVFNALQQESSALLATITTSNNIKQEVELLLFSQHSLKHCSQEKMANALFMSSRSLQRKLKNERTSYGQLLENERKRRAAQSIGTMPLSRLSLELGYQEQSSFNHAFKRWFGCSPKCFLAQQKELTS